MAINPQSEGVDVPEYVEPNLGGYLRALRASRPERKVIISCI
jgi:hypothetical protein